MIKTDIPNHAAANGGADSDVVKNNPPVEKSEAPSCKYIQRVPGKQL